MNLVFQLGLTQKFIFRLLIKGRRLLPKQIASAFGSFNSVDQPKIERIFVINLNRETVRWREMERELKHVLDSKGNELFNRTERYSAVEATNLLEEPLRNRDIDPIYTLADQLFVEPQPQTLPNLLDLNAPIKMSLPEIAIAHSHINLWRHIVAENYEYTLVLEDDVWFRTKFAHKLDNVWNEFLLDYKRQNDFDILYLSYLEVKNGAPKIFLSSNIFKPIRGLWHLSGYVISRKGAKKILRLLPCRGPIDLWLNHQFKILDVRAIRKSIISQRCDFKSTNSYSVLPMLTKIGAITSEWASLFHTRPSEQPVFAFGNRDSGLTSLAMALSLLGYRCCNDLQSLPFSEHEKLLKGRSDRIFNAYVNINSLTNEIMSLRNQYPNAKFIITTNNGGNLEKPYLKILDDLKGTNIALLDLLAFNKWQIICEHLRCAPPHCSYPHITELGLRCLLNGSNQLAAKHKSKNLRHDESPWIVEQNFRWPGIHTMPPKLKTAISANEVSIYDDFVALDTKKWFLRDDTFTDNMALFRPSNIEFSSEFGASLSIKHESLGVREFSAASLTSCDSYLFGRFEAIIKVSNVPGVVTGFFLHRNSPRQEIDIEITGNRTDRLLVNVFYNPGDEGTKYDYGYRGTPSYIDLNFDASQSYHRFAIEWSPTDIRWFVDDYLVHSRVEWGPSPIPHLPMALHINTWPSRSKALAGRLNSHLLPSIIRVKSIALKTNRYCRLG